MPVWRLLDEMPSSEFAEWAAYLKIKHDEQEKAMQQAKAKR
jgi:hypothetical protein